MTPRILIADTNSSLREMLGHLLTLRGFEVVRAADGEEAVSVGRAHELAAAVLDLHLPGWSGFDVCRALRGPSDSRTTFPIWITSGGCHPATALRARAAGALLVVRKPFRPTDLCRRIERELSRHRDRAMSASCA